MLPPGESALSIEIIFSDEIVVPGKFILFPQPQVQPISKGNSGYFLKDETIYQKDDIYPAEPKGKLITSFLNGRAFAISTFTPVRYNPVTGKVSYYSSAKVTVRSVPDAKAGAALSNIVMGNKKASQFADNGEMEKSYTNSRQPATDSYELLIICTAAYSGAFENLRAGYLKEGLQSQITTLESIISTMSGIDTPEKMRNYIIQEYQAHGIQYVLLAGDAEIMPYRGFYAYVQSGSGYADSNIPSDLYFSALDGNWNTDGDALWGEPGEDDLLPDISVGRMPFSNLGELNAMLHKSLSYQFTPVDNEFRNVLLAGEHLYGPPYLTYGSYYLELLIGTRSNNGYTTIGIPEVYPFDKLYDETATWSKQTLMAHLNMGRPMFHHVGHANYTSMMRMGNADITNLNFSGLNGTDHNYTVAYTHGCNCGGFDQNDCIAERTVAIDNFAAAIITNSRYGWFNEGTDEGPSAHLNREFVDALYNDKLNRIGRAHMESKIATAPWVTATGQWEPGALRWCFYDCNVLGDPAMAIFTDNPITIQTVYPSDVTAGTGSMQVSVTSEGIPVEGLSCVVLENGNLIGKSLTNASGNTVINFDPVIANPDNVQLIVSGYNCIPVTYNLTARTYTWNAVSGNWKNPASWSPERIAPAANDNLVFDGNYQVNPAVTLNFTSAENIGRLRLINNVNVNIATASASHRINAGASGSVSPQIEISSGCALTVNSVNPVAIDLPTGYIASISGNIVFQQAAHTITAATVNGIIFNNGASFNAGSNFSGNAFGSSTPNSVLFSNGSVYIQSGGNNPFDLPSPGSVVVFNEGSLYKFNASTGAPDLSGRTYGNLEINSNSSALMAMNCDGSLTVNNLTVTSGICGFNLTGEINIGGNLAVLPGAAINFSPSSTAPVNFNGSANQTIGGGGAITAGNNSTINTNNAEGVNLGSDMVVNGTLFLSNGLLTIGNCNLILGTNAAIGGTPSATNMIVVTGPGELRKSFVSPGIFTFPVGDNSGVPEYSPVTLNFTAGLFDTDAYIGISIMNDAFSGTANSYLDRYWNVTSSGVNNFTCDAQFVYVPADVSGNETDLLCVQILPPDLFLHNPTNTTLHQITASGISSLGIFTGESNDAPKTINLTSIFPEGLYAGNGVLHQAYNESATQWPVGIADHITVEFHEASDYATIIYSATDVELSTTGTTTVNLPAIHNGLYYITIKHRNSLQVVSASPVSFVGNTIAKSFGTPADVLGGNLKQMSDLGYALYGGDVNQDGFINLQDMIAAESDASVFSSGYLQADSNGDGTVDSSDLILIDNNASLFLEAITP
jgi:hypothetical protein